jgi:hypothetical protein
MGVDHGRPHVSVAQQLLHGSYVSTRLQQMSGKRMPKRMARDPLRQPRGVRGA